MALVPFCGYLKKQSQSAGLQPEIYASGIRNSNTEIRKEPNKEMEKQTQFSYGQNEPKYLFERRLWQ